MTQIYTVTTIAHDHLMSGVHCIGFFHEISQAIKAVEDNELDMHENYYKYVVIEEKFPGTYCTNGFQKWFEWKDTGYVPCEVPETFVGTINFGIG